MSRPLDPGHRPTVASDREDLFGDSVPDPARPDRGAVESACPKRTSAVGRGAAESACPSAKAEGWVELKRLAEPPAGPTLASAPIVAVLAERREKAQ
ncbi:MAG: hypothetical protein OXH23_15425 [bacterium]|nr:hypothetical protein [bacterium]